MHRPTLSVTYPLQILYLIVIFKHPLITTTNVEIRKWMNQCKADYNFCPKCFPHDGNDDATIARLPLHAPPQSGAFKAHCEQIENNVAITNDDIIKAFNNLFGTKQISYGNYTDMDGNNDGVDIVGGTRVVIKYLFDQSKLDGLSSDVCEYLRKDGWQCGAPFKMEGGWGEREMVRALRRRFSDKEQMEGCVICPVGNRSAKRFADLVSSRIRIEAVFKWLLINLNVQPLLLSLLNEKDFNVPKLITTYGFISVEQNAGITLYNFYDSSIDVRLLIAKNLLKAVIKLTQGVDGFRIYLTDLNPDNVVVNAHTNHSVAFVDLDNCIILDSIVNDKIKDTAFRDGWNISHVHEKIECKGCFAYVPQEICQHHISDLNVFSACQLLHEDLNEDTTKGLLHSLPTSNDHFVSIKHLLKDCIKCSSVTGHGCDRFNLANRIIEQIDNVLNGFI